MKKLVAMVLALVLCLSTMMVATAEGAYPIPENTTGKVFKIGLSNAYMGNDWRQIMCSVAEWTAAQEPFASNIKLDIVQSDNSAEAQIAAIESMIDGGYDAILIDPSSTSALTNVIKEAQDAGIVVVVFDQGVDYEDVYKISTDYILRAQIGAEYIVQMLGDKGGNVIMDEGLVGASQGTEEFNTAKGILEAAGNINIVTTYQSQYEQGSTYTGVSSALTAASKIDAVWTQGPMTGVIQAFTDVWQGCPGDRRRRLRRVQRRRAQDAGRQVQRPGVALRHARHVRHRHL